MIAQLPEKVESLVSLSRIVPGQRDMVARFLKGIDRESWESYTCGAMSEKRQQELVEEKEHDILEARTIAFAARHGAVILGICFVQPQTDPTRPWDLGLVVAKEHRGKKLGEGLLRAVLKEAIARGVSSIATITGNPAAARVMERAGLSVIPTGEHNEWRADWVNARTRADKNAA